MQPTSYKNSFYYQQFIRSLPMPKDTAAHKRFFFSENSLVEMGIHNTRKVTEQAIKKYNAWSRASRRRNRVRAKFKSLVYKGIRDDVARGMIQKKLNNIRAPRYTQRDLDALIYHLYYDYCYQHQF